MLRLVAPVLVGLLLLTVSDPAGAQHLGSEETRIRADQVSFERERNLYEAEGNVFVEQAGGRSLRADWMVVNTITQIGVAVGHVVLREQGDELRADFAAVDLRTLQAVAMGASLDVPEGLQVAAGWLARTGEGTYRVEDGRFSSCRCTVAGRRPWSLDVGEADVRLGGYAVARDVVFRVLDFPLLYTPWLLLPVKTKRQTGFLLPSLASTSRGGTEVELPFFWAPRDNLNVLLRPTWFSGRGLKLGAETEYVFGEEAWGKGGFAVLAGDDEVEDDPALVFSEDRWAYWLRHEQPLAPGFRVGADVAQLSDNLYALDFEDLPPEVRQARGLDSKVWASFGRSSWFASAEGIYSDDLQSPDDLDRDDFLLQALPDVRLASLPRRLGPLPLFAGLDARYTYFYQSADERVLRLTPAIAGQFFDTGIDGVFDADEPNAAGVFDPLGLTDNHADNVGVGGTEGDGIFQEGELLADFGHRWDVYPRVALPLRLGPVETLTELGYRGTFYSPAHGSPETRSLWTGRIEARMHLAKDLEIAGRQLRHIVEPRIAFGFISDDNQAGNPLFVPQAAVRQQRIIDGDLRVLLRNPSDRVAEERVIQASLGNRFYGAGGLEAGAPPLIGALRIGAGYDLERGRASEVFLDGSFHPSGNVSVLANLGYDPKDTHTEEIDLGISWRSGPRFDTPSSVSERRHELRLGYRYLRTPPLVFEAYRRQDDVFDEFDEPLERIDQISLAANLALVRRLEVFADGFASFEGSSTSGGRLGVTYLPRCACWELTTSIEQRIRPDDTRFTITLRLAGLGFEPLRGRRGRIGTRTGARGSVDERPALWDSPAP